MAVKQVVRGRFVQLVSRRLVGCVSVAGQNTADDEVLTLESSYAPNRFGGAGVSWPRGSTNVYSKLEISYPRLGGRLQSESDSR